MSNIYYRDDLKGYDDLFTFVDIFPTYEEWLKLNDYMFYHEIEEFEKSEKLFNNILNVYKNHFFRFATMPKIYTELSLRIERLYQEIEVNKYISTNAADLAGQKETLELFKTNNTNEETDEENNMKYRTNIETTFTDNGEKEIEIKKGSVDTISLINRFVTDLRTMFMNNTNEVVVKQDIYTKGN